MFKMKKESLPNCIFLFHLIFLDWISSNSEIDDDDDDGQGDDDRSDDASDDIAFDADDDDDGNLLRKSCCMRSWITFFVYKSAERTVKPNLLIWREAGETAFKSPIILWGRWNRTLAILYANISVLQFLCGSHKRHYPILSYY